MDTAFLDWALAEFSGYVAADELYDGPFCILSAVDNRGYKRILYEVLYMHRLLFRLFSLALKQGEHLMPHRLVVAQIVT
jgi:hypothetical protein